MKRWITLVLVLLLLLAGCTEKQPENTSVPPTPPTTTVPAETSEPTDPPKPTEPGIYVPGTELETASSGALRVYNTDMGDGLDEISRGNAVALQLQDGLILVQSTYDEASQQNAYVITRLEGEDLHPVAKQTVITASYLSGWKVRWDENQLACFDYSDYALIVFDRELREAERISLPGEVMDRSFLLSSDFATVYYAVDNAIRELNLNFGNSVLLREGEEFGRYLQSLDRDDTLLRYTWYEGAASGTRIISTNTGELLYEDLETTSDWFMGRTEYMVAVYGRVHEFIFGTLDGETKLLRLGQERVLRDVDVDRGIAVSTIPDGDESWILEAFNFHTGKLIARVTVPASLNYYCLSWDGRFLWMQDVQTGDLIRWEIALSPASDDENYVTPRFTWDNPDLEGFEQVKAHARALSEKLGVKILVWDEISQLENDWYVFTQDFHPELYEQGLAELEAAAARLPEGFLQRVATWGTNRSLTIAFANAIMGDSAYSISSAGGLQFWNSDSAYIVLTMENVESTFFHELFHVIDTAVLSSKNTYDEWWKLNPEGFEYSYDYTTFTSMDADEWIFGEDPTILETYCMTYPHEDRAKVFEYAMMDYDAFTTPTLQRKLSVLCEGIRKTFRLEGELPWEQYLAE